MARVNNHKVNYYVPGLTYEAKNIEEYEKLISIENKQSRESRIEFGFILIILVTLCVIGFRKLDKQ